MQTKQQQLLPLAVVVATIMGATTMAGMATTTVETATRVATTTAMEMLPLLLLLQVEMQPLPLLLQVKVSFTSTSTAMLGLRSLRPLMQSAVRCRRCMCNNGTCDASAAIWSA